MADFKAQADKSEDPEETLQMLKSALFRFHTGVSLGIIID